jgi:hypothetical protein
MLPEHLRGIVGFSEPIATLLGCPVMSELDASAMSTHRRGDRAYFERIKEGSKRTNSCISVCFNSLGFRLSFERGIQVSVCGDLLNVLLKKSFSSQSLILGYVNEFMCQQPKISRAVSANNDAVPRRQTRSIR